MFKASDIDLHQRTRAAKLEPGERDVLVTLSDGGRLVAEKVLVAAGRIGNVEGLDLPAAGLAADERGLLKVNAHYQTAVPHIYAAGDVIGFPALASTSMEQGRVAMSHAFGHRCNQRVGEHAADRHLHHPRGLVGRRDRGDAQGEGHPLRRRAGRASTSNARANLIGEAVGIAEAPRRRRRTAEAPRRPRHRPERLRARPHGRRGDGATRDDLQYFIEAVFNYPTLGEAYKYAAYDALDRIRERREENVWPFTRPAARSQA